jgi:MFS family permease
MIAGGINGLILPLRGSAEGFTTLSLGLLGTGWSIGYVLGCIYTPKLVRRAGHVRTFSVMAAVAVVTVLVSLLLIEPGTWIFLRGFSGFCFAGGAMIVESWLNEQADPKYRGRIFGIYTMVNLGATTAGQMLLATGDSSGHLFFVLAAIFYAMALLPTAVSKANAPKPLVSTRLDLKILRKNSPLAVFSVFMIGLSNSSFGTLGVVFGESINLDVTSIALMMSCSLIAGALFQIPVGYFSDKFDRRYALIGLAIIALSVDMVFILFQPSSPIEVIGATAIFGAAIYSIYPVIIAHASDHAEPGSFIKISGGLLLLYGLGGIIGPIYSGALMAFFPKIGLFLATATSHTMIIAYGLYRISQRDAVAETNKQDFVVQAPGRYSTPETSALDPRSGSIALRRWADDIEVEDQR